MLRFKQFIKEAQNLNPYANEKIGGGGMGGGGFAPKARPSRMAPALRWGNEVVAGKPGGAHSDLIPHAAERGKPDEMGFVRKHTGDEDIGPYKGRFFPREKASILGKKHPDLLNDPDQAKDPPWQAQSYDFKPESGKKRPS